MDSVGRPLRLFGRESRAESDRGCIAARRAGTDTLSDDARSRVIQFARIALITGLVFLHYGTFPNSPASPRVGLDPHSHAVATYVNSFVLFFFFSVVPLLSAISGYLFFSFTEDARYHLRQLIRRRFFSLYLPLVAWNLFYLGILLAVFAAAPDHPLLRAVRIDLGAAGPLDYLNAILGLNGYPLAFQFWFVRDLFVAVLCSPILWWLLRRAPHAGAVGFGAIWLAGVPLGIFLRPDVVCFFYVGGLLRTSGARLEIGTRTTLVLVAMYLAMVAVRAFLPYFYDGAPTELMRDLVVVGTRLMRLVGLLACWGVLVRVAPTRFGRFVASFGGLAFFLYAIHYPLLAELKILLWPLMPAQSDAWMLVHYAASVTLTVAIGIGVGLLLARTLPSAFALMNGGRALGAYASRRRAVAPGRASTASTPGGWFSETSRSQGVCIRRRRADAFARATKE